MATRILHSVTSSSSASASRRCLGKYITTSLSSSCPLWMQGYEVAESNEIIKYLQVYNVGG